MRRKSRVWRCLPALGFMALSACAGPSPPRAVSPPQAATVAPRSFASVSEARAMLAEIADRRRWDAAILRGAASHPDASVRAAAAFAAGRIADERGGDFARGLLADRSPEVRAAAAFACRILEEPAATSELILLLADPDPSVAAAAADAVGALGRGDGEDALIGAIPKAPAPEPRAAMLQALWRFADPASAAAAAAYAADPDGRVRAAALYALSRKPVESSLPVLTAALSDADPSTAAGAARALGILAKAESAQPLAAALDTGRAPVETGALNSLEAVLEKNPGVTLPAESRARVLALAGDANPNLAIPALVLLRQFLASDREALTRLWSIATTGQGRRRQVALLSAVAALRERARGALDPAAESPDAPLRAAAAESLFYLPNAGAAPYRARLAADPNPLVRISVLASLRSAESVADNRALVDAAFSDPDAGVRAAAIEALSLLNDAAVLPQFLSAVQKASTDSAPDVPIAAIVAAEKVRSVPEARAVVEAAYRLPKTLVQRLARRSLITFFRADPAAYHAPEYRVDRSTSDYATLLDRANRPWKADVETVRGTFSVRLRGDLAPLTVMNLVELAGQKFFDGVAIHRVVPGFVVQDGDPTGTGNGGPGYEIRDENNPAPYGTGTVGMALSGPDTGGSQWFVTQAPEPHLNGLYTVFGEVVAGQDVVQRIEQWDRIVRVTVSEAP